MSVASHAIYKGFLVTHQGLSSGAHHVHEAGLRDTVTGRSVRAFNAVVLQLSESSDGMNSMVTRIESIGAVVKPGPSIHPDPSLQ